MDSSKSPDSQNTLYSPPAPEALEAFARQVCHRLGTDHSSSEVVEGFSAFIKVAADIQTKHLNKQILRRVDNEE